MLVEVGMSKVTTKIICPVCEMKITSNDLHVSHQGMDFIFARHNAAIVSGRIRICILVAQATHQ